MISKASQPSLPASGNLKRAFENAVRDIYEVGLTGQASRYRRPIVQRAGRAIPGILSQRREAGIVRCGHRFGAIVEGRADSAR